MKIQNFTLNSIPPSPYSSSPISSSSISSLPSSSINSSSSSIPSTPSSPFSSPSSSPRCVGLDLLVKAIYQVTDGSIIGVPYIQKRVIRRRSRRSKNLIFDHTLVFQGNFDCKNDSSGSGGNGDGNSGLIKKQRKAKKMLASKSCLQTWKPKSRYGRDLSKLVTKL